MHSAALTSVSWTCEPARFARICWEAALRIASVLLLAAAPTFVAAQEVRFVPVAPGVYAHLGDTGPRTVENQALNANIGRTISGWKMATSPSAARW